MSITVRMCFSKTGRAIYISHLDLIRCFQRAVCRAGLPAAYSEGFHPHMQTSFAATLPLGFSSTSEIMDLELGQEVPYEKVREKLNQTLPEDIQILRAGAPELAFKALACAEYSIRIHADQPELLAESLEQFLAQSAILTEKRSKKGMREVDLKPMILDAQTVFTVGSATVPGLQQQYEPESNAGTGSVEKIGWNFCGNLRNSPGIPADRTAKKIFLKKHLHF